MVKKDEGGEGTPRRGETKRLGWKIRSGRFVCGGKIDKNLMSWIEDKETSGEMIRMKLQREKKEEAERNGEEKMD